MRRRVASIFLILAVAFTGATPASAANDSNCVADFLTGADRQFETQDQGQELQRALSEMLSEKPATSLLTKRYRDYQMTPHRWNAVDVLHRYFVPTNSARVLNRECFLKSIGTSASRLAIKKQLDDLSKDLANMSKEKSSSRSAKVAPPVVPETAKRVDSVDEKLFDNISINRALLKALQLSSQSDMTASKKVWKQVINFMHQPRWFPTAAAVPICSNFAKLADICIDKNQIEDAHELLRASFEFPFYLQGDEDVVDAAVAKLVKIDRSNGNSKSGKSLLEFAITKVQPARREKYQELLKSL